MEPRPVGAKPPWPRRAGFCPVLKIVIDDIARTDGDTPRHMEEALRGRLGGDAVDIVDTAYASSELRDRAFAEADILVTRRLNASHPLLPRLGLLQVPAAGAEMIDRARLPSRCQVATLHDHGPGAAEFVMAAMLDWSVRLSQMSASFRRGPWAHGSVARAPYRAELDGRTLSIVGFGAIGRAVGIRAKAFGMRIETLNRTLRADPIVDRGFAPDERDAFLARADFLLLACPLTDATRGLIDARALSCMKRSAFLINIARADVTVEEDIYRALSERLIAGAALDVWWRYPSAEEPERRPSRFAFHSLANVVMTPHVATWSESLPGRRLAEIARNIDAYRRSLDQRASPSRIG